MKHFFINLRKTLHLLAISSVILMSASTVEAQVKIGANPASISTSAVLDVEGTSGQHAVILQNGNMGINQTVPSNKLHVSGVTDPVRLEGLQISNSASDKSVVVDANGVLKTTSNGASQTFVVYNVGGSTMFRGPAGNSSNILNDAVLVNNIPGVTYDQTTNIVTIPPGTYLMTFTLSASIKTSAVTNPIHSYFFDFPSVTNVANDGRIHANSPSNSGPESSHGVSISYAAQYGTTRAFNFAVGWGDGGNMVALNSLTVRVAQLAITRIGD